ncbi:hypothetical protein [Acinetobacter sp.]|uniref:hypothetical protein n=1 Tax=Acinetobacter sp. TaxID=472 RepID=UPI003890F75F
MKTYETFENVGVLYMFRQASLPFFHMGSYPVYKMENGKVVHDRSEKTQKFQKEMRELCELMTQVSSRVERNMKVPATWMKKLRVEGLAAVLVAKEHKSTFTEWAENYERTLRFLATYTA